MRLMWLIFAFGALVSSQTLNAGVGGFLSSAGRIAEGIERQRNEQARRQLELERIRLCNEIIRLGGQCASPNTSAASEEHLYENATLFGQTRTGDISINSCKYATARGYRFAVNYRGICPYSVRVNPETNWVLFN